QGADGGDAQGRAEGGREHPVTDRGAVVVQGQPVQPDRRGRVRARLVAEAVDHDDRQREHEEQQVPGPGRDREGEPGQARPAPLSLDDDGHRDAAALIALNVLVTRSWLAIEPGTKFFTWSAVKKISSLDLRLAGRYC